MIKAKSDSKSLIRALNDSFRRTFVGGLVTMTSRVGALSADKHRTVLAKVRGFDAFDANNDVHGEHDFGVVQIDDVRCFR